MTRENGLTPTNRDLEPMAEITWQRFINRANELSDNLRSMYDESPVKRDEYHKGVCIGGSNFGKTIKWIVDYAAHPDALESVASSLEAIVSWPNAGSMAWEMRRFIKGSHTWGHLYDNVPEVIKFGELIKKIGTDDPTNRRGFQLDLDFFYWDAGWGVDSESTEEEMIQGHHRNVIDVVDSLERYAHPEIINAKAKPTQEESEAKEREEQEQYWNDFLADARSSYRHPSFSDLLDTDELINRPYRKIMTYPAEIADIANGAWINHKYEDPSDAVTHYYRELPYMVAERSGHWFPSPLPYDYVDRFSAKFERRLKRTLEQKPCLIDFSVKYQDVLQRSFIGGNHQTNHAGEVELVFKNPNYNPRKGNFFSDEYEWRRLAPEEERLFFESVTNVLSLEDSRPAVEPPKQSSVFNGETGRPYLFELADGREFNIFLKHEYGSIYWEGKVVIIARDGQEPLFQHDKQELKSEATLRAVDKSN